MEINGINYRCIAKDRNGVLVAAAHSADKLAAAVECDGYVLADRVNDGDIHHKTFLAELAEF